MIELIDRKTFFAAHPVAGRYMAKDHQWCYHHLREDAPRLAAALLRRGQYDCLHYPTGKEPALNGLQALAYGAASRQDYRAHFARHVLRFLQELGAQEIYLFNEFGADWLHYEFESFAQRNALRRLTRRKNVRGCFKTDAEGFGELFPLLLLPRHRDESRKVYLYASGMKAEAVLFLCDDGNLHTSYRNGDEAMIRNAASAAGLHWGEPFFICGTHYVLKMPAR